MKSQSLLRASVVLALTSMLGQAMAQNSNAAVQKRRVVEPGGLMTHSGGVLASCQPWRGDLLLVRRVRQQELTMQTVVEVQVLSGECKHSRGYMHNYALSPSDLED